MLTIRIVWIDMCVCICMYLCMCQCKLCTVVFLNKWCRYDLQYKFGSECFKLRHFHLCTFLSAQSDASRRLLCVIHISCLFAENVFVAFYMQA